MGNPVSSVHQSHFFYVFQQMAAFTSVLKGQMEAIESMFDKAAEQLRHAADACSIIEALKHPGGGARWLFGYGGGDE